MAFQGRRRQPFVILVNWLERPVLAETARPSDHFTNRSKTLQLTRCYRAQPRHHFQPLCFCFFFVVVVVAMKFPAYRSGIIVCAVTSHAPASNAPELSQPPTAFLSRPLRTSWNSQIARIEQGCTHRLFCFASSVPRHRRINAFKPQCACTGQL